MKFNLQSNQPLCSSFHTGTAAQQTALLEHQELPTLQAGIRERMCQCPLVSETVATSSDQTHFSPYHFCHSMSKSEFPITSYNSDFYTGLRDVLAEFRR